ncbi:MAG TPA: hypothetical protein VJQ59_06760 [Candidatus Sulfotelmatobacter sp.]|nr:hypothetical protein [Candidatus Sulfotelmatobacter sp.]
MDNYKLKIRIGSHEFEAEGPVSVVQAQFEAFKELIASRQFDNASITPIDPAQYTTETNINAVEPALTLDKITRIDERIVSLTARPETIEDAALVILLGQRTFRSNDSVTGSEVIDGLRQSGLAVSRVDWRLEKLASQGLIIKIGSNRASRYRLTNQGVNKAQAVARALISLVP